MAIVLRYWRTGGTKGSSHYIRSSKYNGTSGFLSVTNRAKPIKDVTWQNAGGSGPGKSSVLAGLFSSKGETHSPAGSPPRQRDILREIRPCRRSARGASQWLTKQHRGQLRGITHLLSQRGCGVDSDAANSAGSIGTLAAHRGHGLMSARMVRPAPFTHRSAGIQESRTLQRPWASTREHRRPQERGMSSPRRNP
ncbi:hypothetical protein AB1N83_006293 [Pleurotus pulmonarius]